MGLQHSQVEGRDRERGNPGVLDAAVLRLFEADPDGIVVVDHRGHCTFANPAALALLAYQRDDLLGQSLDARLRPEPRDSSAPVPFRQLAAAIAERGSALVSQAIFHRRDGSRLAVETSAIGLQPEVVVRFTPARPLPARDARLLHLLEAIGEGALAFDLAGRIEFANAAAERILGLSRAQLIGGSHATLPWRIHDQHERPLAPDDLPTRVALRGGKPVLDRELEVAVGERRVPLVVSAFPVRDEQGELNGVVLTFRDISARR